MPGGGPGTPAAADLRAPAGWRLWFNLALTAALIVALVAELMPLEVLFVLAFAIAVLVNRRPGRSSGSCWTGTARTSCWSPR